MRLRLTKLDEFQFLTCVQHQLWGSKSARFKDWKIGDYLVFIVDKAIAGLAEVSEKPYVSKQIVWDDGLFPHRIPIKLIHLFLPENRPPVLGEIRDALTSVWGPRYGWGILNQQLLSGNFAENIIKVIRSRRNDLAEIQMNLDHYLEEAKHQRDIIIRPKSRRGRPKKLDVKTRDEKEITISREEESTHSKVQSNLIRLGKIAGCSVWIASNDRNRQYKGKSLGEECLKSLPRLGLSEEATKRISLIDVIWLQQKAPVCAFEVETTTSIYSGLFRMSDLLSEVPALNIKLFIIAPKNRQDKVMGELARPTFQKIGLSEYCRFIAIEDLELLISKVKGLGGHVQPSIIDTIAVELEDELESILEK